MTSQTLTQPLPASSYTVDLVVALGGAAMGTLGIVLLYKEPVALAVFMALLLAALLLRWHTKADLVGLLVGCTLGNLTEFLCDWKGIWVHHTRGIMDIAPVYILICYPVLWLTVPRLMDALVRRPRPVEDGHGNAPLWGLFFWGAHLGLSLVFGLDNTPQFIMCVTLLGFALWRFHGPHDVAAALFGGCLGLVWELPVTTTGGWVFPNAQLLGLIPFWLPFAYAVFFLGLCRVNAGLVRRFVAA